MKTGFDKLKAFLPKKGKPTRTRRVTDEEEEDDEAVPSYFAEPSEEPDEPEESDKRDEDEDYE